MLYKLLISSSRKRNIKPLFSLARIIRFGYFSGRCPMLQPLFMFLGIWHNPLLAWTFFSCPWVEGRANDWLFRLIPAWEAVVERGTLCQKQACNEERPIIFVAGKPPMAKNCKFVFNFTHCSTKKNIMNNPLQSLSSPTRGQCRHKANFSYISRLS